MGDFATQPSFEIGRRLEIRGSSTWIALIGVGNQARDDLALDLRVFLESPVRTLTAEESPTRMRELLNNPPDDTVMIAGFGGFAAKNWKAWDVGRSHFERPGPIVLWMSPLDFSGLCENAPNIRSFLGGSVFALGPSGEPLTPAEVKTRIREFERHYGMGSKRFIGLAETGQLRREPEHLEWLILLDRGDLV